MASTPARTCDADAKAGGRHRPAAAALAALALCGLLACLIAGGAALLAQHRAQARWMAELLVPAATFSDAAAARQALQALHHLPQVRQAWLIDSQDRLLAHHVAASLPPARLDARLDTGLDTGLDTPRATAPTASATATAVGIDGPSCRAMAASPGWALQAGHLLLAQAVRFKDVPVGCLCLDIGPAQGLRQAIGAGALALLAWAVWRGRLGQHRSVAA